LTVCWRLARPLTACSRGSWNPAPEDIQLDFNAQKGLQNAVVEVAGDAAALGFDGAGA